MSDLTPSTSPTSQAKTSSESAKGGSTLFDELDTLLQRMLDLPVHAGEENAPPALPSTLLSSTVQSDSVTEMPGTAPLPPATVVYQPMPEEKTAPEPSPTASAPRAPKPLPVAPFEPMKPHKSEKVTAEQASPDDDTNTEMITTEKPLLLYPPPHYPLWQRPLVWINHVFDHLASLMGPVGRGVRHPWGRFCLGIVGLLLWVIALGLIFSDWIGWTW